MFFKDFVSVKRQKIKRGASQTYDTPSNDVSAFIDNVRDLNDEACALMKVEAPSDFAFSTPLGIVKRKDEVGEIWLYLPKGTKMLTLKHPEWGVIRDYKLDKPLESRMTYELKLNFPKPTITEVHDTIVEVKTVTDTITIPQQRSRKPLQPQRPQQRSRKPPLQNRQQPQQRRPSLHLPQQKVTLLSSRRT